MKIAITGHRPHKLGNDYDLTSPLIAWIKYRILYIVDFYIMDTLAQLDNGVTLITGMALGIDTLFAKIAIENNIPFIAAIPCLGQESKWIDKSKKLYREITNHPLCTAELVTNTHYTYACMQKRNEWMVDNCDLLIAVWDGTTGGTKNCVDYATKVGKQIIRINPNDFKNEKE